MSAMEKNTIVTLSNVKLKMRSSFASMITKTKILLLSLQNINNTIKTY